MIKTFMLAQEFEALVRKIYEANGYKIIREPRPAEMGFDLLLESPQGETVVVEVKVSRSRVVPRADILRMLDQVNRTVSETKAARGLLVIGGSIGIPIQDAGEAEIVDLNGLSELAAPHPNLLSELYSISRELAPMPMSDFDARAYRVFGDAHMGASVVPGAPLGGQLDLALQSVSAGKKGAREFEAKCFDALKYIFGADFSNWSKQKVSDGGLTRFDVIARISSEHDFWKSIVVYFRTWYVVFEFKNYTKRVSQAEVITTERYLFPSAMRTVAFIISRKGADKNALAVTRGAVRETGKLIIHLSLADLRKLLQMKDNNDDPNSFLFDHLDGMLMKLER
ncbi:MAG: restriction endonuclease [Pseudomonadota bacterium]